MQRLLKNSRKILPMLFFGMLTFFSKSAQALIEGNLYCPSQPRTVDLIVTPGESMSFRSQGTCTVSRRFPYSAGLNFGVVPSIGQDDANLRASTTGGIYLRRASIGVYNPPCLGPAGCAPLAQGATFGYDFTVTGSAPSTPGSRTVLVSFGVTSQNWVGYGEWFSTTVFRYTVRAPACSLTSPANVNLNFGTISSAELSNKMESATVSVNCVTPLRANVSLVPNQAVVNSTNGMSRTSLAGLDMQALWGGTLSPVNFDVPRNIQMNTGNNNITLGFKPVLSAGQSPSGAFNSQYTLNIEYQ